MRPPLLVSTLAASLLVLAGAASAHHGWSSYDSSREMTLTGSIAEAGYEHPHGYVKLQTPGKLWVGVLAPPTRMENRGLPRTMVKEGATAPAGGWAALMAQFAGVPAVAANIA